MNKTLEDLLARVVFYLRRNSLIEFLTWGNVNVMLIELLEDSKERTWIWKVDFVRNFHSKIQRWLARVFLLFTTFSFYLFNFFHLRAILPSHWNSLVFFKSKWLLVHVRSLHTGYDDWKLLVQLWLGTRLRCRMILALAKLMLQGPYRHLLKLHLVNGGSDQEERRRLRERSLNWSRLQILEWDKNWLRGERKHL